MAYDPLSSFTPSAPKKTIAQLQAEATAASAKADALVSKAEASTIKMDPSFGVTVAQNELSAAKPGSPAYIAALNDLTQAKNVASGVTAQRDVVRQTINAGVTGGGGGGYTGGGSTGGGTTDTTSNALLQQLLAQQNEAAAIAQKDKEQARQSAIDVLTARFKQYGLESLSSAIVKLATDGASEATITLGLQETPEYKARFKANADRVTKGLSVLSPGDYLNLEDTYRQVLRSYGLTQFDNDSYVSQFISNDMSATELAGRVDTAVKRVQNADPTVMQQLTDYYGIASKDLVAYVLDPQKQLVNIEQQVTAGEIGAAATKQGLITAKSVAEQLAAAGVTQTEAQKGYSTIAEVLPTSEKLSGIYSAQGISYTQADAEQDVFNGLASAKRKREQLVSSELGSFSGQAGTSKGAFSTGYLNRQGKSGAF